MSLTPGFHDIPAARYHADDLAAVPTLSSSVAGLLLDATPRHAWFAHPRLHAEFEAPDSNKAIDVGAVAHELILDKGGGVDVLEFDAWTTKASKEARAAAIDAGLTPILLKDYVRAEAIAEAVKDAIAFTPGCLEFADPGARSETVLLWQDIGGPMCRAMLDRLTPSGTIYDIKTGTRGLGTRTLQNKIADGLDMRAAFYIRGLNALNPDLAGRWKWRWIFVEQDEPHEVRIIEADAMTLAIGDRKAALAIEIWRECMVTGEWPGYPRHIDRIDYPAKAEASWLAREVADDRFDRATVSCRAPAPATAPDHLIFGDTRLDITP